MRLLVFIVLSAFASNAYARPPDCPEAVSRADSDAAAAAEWKRPVVRARVGHDLHYYRDIRYLFVTQRDICGVGDYLAERVVPATFLGHRLVVHEEVAACLAQAEAALDPPPSARRIGSLQVRTIRGPFGRAPWLSNHALGTAIDIDPGHNLYLSPAELRLLAEVSGVTLLLDTAHDAGERWDSLREAQAAFRKKVGPWRAAQSRKARGLARQARRGDAQAKRELDAVRGALRLSRGRKLNAARKGGFLNHPRRLVVALEGAGMTWCTDFISGADLMHFELRSP